MEPILNSHSRRYGDLYPFAMTGIFLLAAVARLFGLNKGLWLDEYLTIKVITAHNFWQAVRLDNHPPLFYLFHKIGSLVGMNEVFLRLISVLFGAATVIIMILWLRMYSRFAGILAGILCASMPVLLRYSQEIRGYPVLLFMTACSFYFASRLFFYPRRTFEYAGLTCSLTAAVCTHLTGILLVPAVAAFILAAVDDFRKMRLNLILVGLGIPCLVFAYLYFFFLLDLPDGTGWWMPAVSWQYSITTFKYLLGISFLFGGSKFLAGFSPAVVTLYESLIILLLCGILAGMLLFGTWRRGLPFLLAAALYWLRLTIYSVLRTPIFFYYTALPGLIPFIGFIAVQIDSIRIRAIRAAAASGILLIALMFLSGWIFYEASTPVEYWKQITRVLEEGWKPGDQVIFYPENSEGPVRYYFMDLPASAGSAVRLNSDQDVLELLASQEGAEEMDRLFFIARLDANVFAKPYTYQNLLERLNSKFGKPVFSQKLENLVLFEFRGVED